ncbi:MAG: hypothetical protein ACO3YO_08865, partial [Chthoniobacterales bacterium]
KNGKIAAGDQSYLRSASFSPEFAAGRKNGKITPRRSILPRQPADVPGVRDILTASLCELVCQ